MRILVKFIEGLGSFWLASILLVLLLVLTLAGTFEQGRSTLYDVQTNYFESLLVVHHWGGKYPMPLPGGYLLLGLLFVNLLVGGILRVRMGRSTLGVYITHIGILLLLLGGFVEDRLATKGSLQVWEPRPQEDALHVGDAYRSSHDWEVAVGRLEDDGSTTEFVVPHDAFAEDGPDHVARGRATALPFDVVLSGYLRNARLKRLPPDRQTEGVEGRILEARPPITAKEERRSVNRPGLYVTLEEKASGRAHRGLLWAGQRQPYRVVIGDQPWSVELRRRTWPLPFRVRLDKFVHEFHPGTGRPRRFSSYVTVTEMRGGNPVDREVHITMNEPLRYQGYTLYQSGWGPQDPRERGADRRMYSVFSVVNNPSDYWLLGISTPIWACAIIFLGMALHYGRKLVRYLEEMGEKQAATHGSVS